MGMFKRLGDVLRSNLSELIGKAEDPEKLIKLYLEDAKSYLGEARTAVHTTIAAEKGLQAEVDKLKPELEKWQERAEMAVKAGKDDLAKEALEKQAKVQAQLNGLNGPLDQAKKQSAAAKDNLRILEEKIEDAQKNASVLIARARAAESSKKTADAVAKIGSHNPLGAMGSMEDKIRREEAEAAASMEMIGGQTDSTEKKFRELEIESDVDAKLIEMKARLGK